MPSSLVRLLSIASTALLAYVAARAIREDVRVAWLLAVVAALVLVPSILARRRMKRMLLSGDVPRIVGAWQVALGRARHPETMAPLMTATAYAAYGFIEPARRSLARAAKGPVWEAALEQRLFVEALLDVFEGERVRAITKAEELERLPLPESGFWIRRKIARLRHGVAALTRAFAHASLPRDERALDRAARSSPLVHWAMRYAQAVVLVDGGRGGEARTLLADAPTWPEESAFRLFHDELQARLT